MEKRKAIQILRRMQDQGPYDPEITEEAFEALDIAIEAIEGKGMISAREVMDILEETKKEVIKGNEGTPAAGIITASIGIVACKVGKKMEEKDANIINEREEKLKPCPFCGGKANVFRGITNPVKDIFYVECRKCRAYMGRDELGEDIEEIYNGEEGAEE